MIEWAKRPEKTIDRERATKVENTRNKERAIYQENTSQSERARKVDETDYEERAKGRKRKPDVESEPKFWRTPVSGSEPRREIKP